MKLVIFITLIIMALMLCILVNRRPLNESVLCMEYAKSRPETAINQERMDKMGYLWEDFDWYESCMKN